MGTADVSPVAPPFNSLIPSPYKSSAGWGGLEADPRGRICLMRGPDAIFPPLFGYLIARPYPSGIIRQWALA